ncbi:hydantoinase/oxoprolinase family protein [Parvularcula sp. IMCC14364]|uniref:hydantoinase/oxoprolinase family protein n=1 Tax=Parvularcula sp. IMCC14364 TaxID=3067902 RepID=UPI0027429464|nr:hydantoinase/oxoprolinase family protein [Parvularcula sp. IMCC14364]
MNKPRLAVDIGGTFTDVVLEMADGSRRTTKTLTTHHAPAQGVLSAIQEVMRASEISPENLGMIVHGTTLATNALIERRGAKTALLTTQGHRDSLEMAYENRFEQYDINIDRPQPLVPRWLRLPVRERMDKDGNILVPLDEKSVTDLLPTLDSEEVQSVAIGFLHAYANRTHEEQVADLLAHHRPHLSLTLASEVAPEIREYERLSTAVANAYVRPLLADYLHDLSSQITAYGFTCPFYLISSGAGLLTVEIAARFPIRLVESGPAGGAILASSIARECEARSVISYDMGGTTAKLCLIDAYEPKTSRTFEVDRSYRFKKGSGLPVRIPVIEMVEIGAGGGSIASVDKLNRIQAGPESAGSEPGPAAYNKGGSSATTTDADLVLGKIVPDRFADGKIRLNEQAALDALSRDIAEKLDLQVMQAAFGFSEVVDENMSNAARAHAVEQGADITGRTMMAFGGAAPLHAARLAEKLGIEEIIVPADAGVGSAIGFLLAPVSYEVVRSRYMLLDALNAKDVEQLVQDMRREAREIVAPALGSEKVEENCTAFMRYAGQGHEIAIPFSPVNDVEALGGNLRSAFSSQYKHLFGRTIPDMPVEILTWSLAMTGPKPNQEMPPALFSTHKVTTQISRQVFDPYKEKMISYSLHERTDLPPGSILSGPALILESQTTIVVTSTFDARILQNGHVLLYKKVTDTHEV